MKPSDRAPKPRRRPQVAPQLSVIVPTFNECDNVTTLFRRLETALAGIAWEVIFVDDNSPDGTWDVVRDLARQDSRVRCIRRIGRRGLSGACIEGILASSAPCAAVIDADLQHDETQLPKMLALLQGGESDLVVGSRYIEGGSADSFDQQRAGASALATEVARARAAGQDRRSDERLLHDPPRSLRAIGAAALDPGLQDPARYRRHRARPSADQGNSLQLRLAAARRKQAGFDGGAGFPGAGAGEADPRRRCRCASCCSRPSDRSACSCILPALFVALAGPFICRFAAAQGCGALLAMTSNFILNNFLTYRDQRLNGLAHAARASCCFTSSAASGSLPMSASRSRSTIRSRSGGSPARPAR